MNSSSLTPVQSAGHAVTQLEALFYKAKVAGSIPVGVNGILHLTSSFWMHYSPGVDSATDRNTRSIFWGKRCPVRWDDSLTILLCRLSRNCWSLDLLEPKGYVHVCTGVTLPSVYLLFAIASFAGVVCSALKTEFDLCAV